MPLEKPYRTWRQSRGNRLPSEAYPGDTPVHVILGTHRKQAFFAERRVAEAIFAIVSDHPQTLAACLMPDHLHWLLRDAGQMIETVQRLKSFSTRVAWKHGHEKKLWQRSFWDHVLRRREDVREVAEYILANPVRAGIVERARESPYRIVRW